MVPGQLMRNLDNPSFKSDLNEAHGKGLEIKLTQTTVVRKRSVKEEPCLKDIDDYDLYLQSGVSKKIGCIPPFWSFRLKGILHLEECTSLESLREVNAIISDIHKGLIVDFEPPCLDMFNSVVWNWVENHTMCEKCIDLEVAYLDKYYEEIKQLTALSFEDFISNLGGFIGIFLGYSMMQIPELLGKFLNIMINVKK